METEIIFDGKSIETLTKEIENKKNEFFTNENILSTIEIIKIEIDNWIKTYDNLFKNYEKTRKINYSKYDSPDETLNNYNLKKNLLMKHIQNGYILIHKIREKLTGQEIIYNIMVSSSSNDTKTYHILELNMQQLLENSDFTLSGKSKKNAQYIDTKQKHKEYKSLSLSLQIEQEKLMQIANKITSLKYEGQLKEIKIGKNQTLKLEDNQEKFTKTHLVKDKKTKEENEVIKEYKISHGDVLYNDLYYYYINKAENFNRGHIFEMYNYLLNRKEPYKTNRHYKMNSKFITKAFRYVKNSTPSIKAGDATKKNEEGKLIGVQLKNIVESSANLIDSSSIVTWLKGTKKALEKTKKEDIVNELCKIFVDEINGKKDLRTGLDKAFANEARKAIDKTIGNMLKKQ